MSNWDKVQSMERPVGDLPGKNLLRCKKNLSNFKIRLHIMFIT